MNNKKAQLFMTKTNLETSMNLLTKVILTNNINITSLR